MLVFAKKENCVEVYIGETKIFLNFRLDNHCGYIANKHMMEATGEHFNLPGNSLADISVTAIEKVKENNQLYRKER